MNLPWSKLARRLPLDRYSWSKILSPTELDFLVEKKVLQYSDKPVRWLSIDGYDYHTNYVGNTWLALCDDENCDNDEIELSDTDILGLALSPKSLASNIAEVLGMSGGVSLFKYNENILYLGILNAAESYDVIFALDPFRLDDAISYFCRDRKTIVITLEEMSGDISGEIIHNGGFCFKMDDCIDFTENGFALLGELKDALKSPRVKKTKDGFYSWAGVVGHFPKNPSLKILKIHFKNAAEISVEYGEDKRDLCYEDVSIFRNNNTKEANNNWDMMFAASLKKPYRKQSVSEDSMKSYVKKLNREFREFFGLGNLATAFSFINGILNPNFNLTNYRENNRNRSQVFNKVGAALKDHEDFDDPFANEK